MPTAWRLVRAERSADAFTGEGARLYGGRWNSPGKAVIYTSEHQATAVLEILVHVRPLPQHWQWVGYQLDIPRALI